MSIFDFSGRSLDLSVPHVMGILNVTPDSFSDGGELLDGSGVCVSLSKSLSKAEFMVNSGAAIIDVGGESTRPGAKKVSSQEEMDRVLPVVEAVGKELDVIISVDTSNPDLISQCAKHKVGLINDVRALCRVGALEAAAASNIPVCLMHMQGQPETMQDAPQYHGVMHEIMAFLKARVLACEQAGIPQQKILLDPGFGFGKTLEHNIELLSELSLLEGLGLPLLIGVSRKRMLGAITDKPEKERVACGLGAAVIGVMNGARIVRTHDVDETVDAMKMCAEVLQYKS